MSEPDDRRSPDRREELSRQAGRRERDASGRFVGAGKDRPTRRTRQNADERRSTDRRQALSLQSEARGRDQTGRFVQERTRR